MPFREYRKLFPITAKKIYLNHASISPLSSRVTDILEWHINERMFGMIDVYPESDKIRDKARALMADLLNASAEEIAFTSNTSDGLNLLANGINWREGDEIILTDYEFPANIYPFLNQERKGVKIVYVPNRDGEIHIEDILERINSNTRLLSISFVEFGNGFKNDLKTIGQICKEHNIIFSVDGIQGLGAIPLDVKDCQIDFLSNGGHKWLMGPMGVGIIYINKNLFNKLNPAYAGWLSVNNAWDFYDYKLDFLPDAGRFEYGTANYMGIAGFSASLGLLLEIGIENIRDHLLNIGGLLVEGLTSAGMIFCGSANKKHWSGIFSFSGDKIEELHSSLVEKDIVCALRAGKMRFAPHFYNTKEEIEEVIQQVKIFYQNA